MKPRQSLPCVTDEPKAAFLSGWWAGIAVGMVNGLAIALIVWKAMK